MSASSAKNRKRWDDRSFNHLSLQEHESGIKRSRGEVNELSLRNAKIQSRKHGLEEACSICIEHYLFNTGESGSRLCLV